MKISYAIHGRNQALVEYLSALIDDEDEIISGNEPCSGDYVFFLDTFEIPQTLLIQKIKSIIADTGAHVIHVVVMSHKGLDMHQRIIKKNADHDNVLYLDKNVNLGIINVSEPDTIIESYEY